MKVRTLRTIIAAVVMVATLMTSGTVSFAMNSTKVNDVKATEEELNRVVINQIISVTNTESRLEPDGDAIKFVQNEDVSESLWGKGVDLKNEIPLYGLDDQITAYIYELEDLSGNNAGYITVSASKTRFPIISYQETDKHFIRLAEQKFRKENSTNAEPVRYYYLDNGLYVAKKQKEYYNISTADMKPISEEHIQELRADFANKKSSTMVDDISLNAEAWGLMTGDWSKETNGAKGHNGSYTWPITNPASYESGYDLNVADYCGSMGTEFYDMDDLPNGLSINANNHCAPTSATNMTAYWRRRQPTLCANVATATTGLSVYRKVFNAYYVLMGGDGPILAELYKSSLVQYFKNKGLTNAYGTIDTYPQFETDYKAEINAGRPVPTLFWSHSYYSWHWVTTFGYRRFKYGSTYQNYIRIADGWCTNANRYDYAGTNDSHHADNIIKFHIQ
ncbi:MAG: hypothetical protein IJ744_05960 [Lachnospiraceae bacterium]|nr:hypothetical protein [Lachnospiraceae bacterium]